LFDVYIIIKKRVYTVEIVILLELIKMWYYEVVIVEKKIRSYKSNIECTMTNNTMFHSLTLFVILYRHLHPLYLAHHIQLILLHITFYYTT